MAALTTKQLRTWRDDLVRAGARTRTAKGEAQRHQAIDDDEALRARRASVNRNWATLRAALNHAFSEGHVETDREWRKVKPFKGVDGKRTEYLTIAEAKRLINTCDPDFRLLVQAALATGGRYSSLTNLQGAGLSRPCRTIDLRTRKGDGSEKSFPSSLNRMKQCHFSSELCGPSSQRVDFREGQGGHGSSHQTKPMFKTCKRAKINSVGFNQLRHTWASHAVMNGTPLLVVAKNLATATRAW